MKIVLFSIMLLYKANPDSDVYEAFLCMTSL
jgi:hypothetical protein